MDKNQSSKSSQLIISLTGIVGIKSANAFLGEKGETLLPKGDNLYLDETKISDANLHPFHYYSENQEKTIYFFIVRAADGTYRAAANACEVCYGSQKGFQPRGDQIVCVTCQTSYSKDQIALQQGGCNPRPISKDVKVAKDRLEIKLSDLEEAADLF